MSPYRIDKEQGGDSPENVKWMENCVRKVMDQGKDKGSAIAICKTSLKKSKGNKEVASFILDEMILRKLI